MKQNFEIDTVSDLLLQCKNPLKYWYFSLCEIAEDNCGKENTVLQFKNEI